MKSPQCELILSKIIVCGPYVIDSELIDNVIWKLINIKVNDNPANNEWYL